MRLATIRVENFRCLEEVTLELDDLTVLVGANGSGKSTLLRGLDWFFGGEELQLDDVYRHQDGVTVRVSCTFSGFTAADRVALGSYAIGDSAIFTRTWSETTGPKPKLTGKAFTYPPFDAIRALEGAVPQRVAFNEFVDGHPEPGLEKVGNREQLATAMATFEQGHPELLEPTEADATHMFGFVGGARLNGRFSFVFVPAVSDAHEELAGARGTLLSRLVERLPNDAGAIATELEALKQDAQDRADTLMREQHGEALAQLGGRMTEAMREFVPEAEVTIDVEAPSVRVTDPVFDVRVADDGVSTDVAHQGHGFQRALIMAALNELARSEEEGDVPAVLLAIEEPELFQHPLQARHFASVLGNLPRSGEGSFQVAYATHSQFFISPERYERLRRFTRRRADGQRVVSIATIARVAARLQRILPTDEIPRRIKMTLERQIAESVFADVAVLVEGKTDAGLLAGVADRSGGFESQGIALVNLEGKMKLPVAAAVLGELGIPTYVVFDADRGKRDRSLARIGEHDGRREEKLRDIETEVGNTITWNRRLLSAVGAPPEDWPESGVAERYAVFADTIEEVWPAAMAEAARLAGEANDDPKREEWYRESARTLEDEPPRVLSDITAAIRALR